VAAVAIDITTDLASGQAKVTFSLAADDPGVDAGVVSVVGSFNDWEPGLHTLIADDHGNLAVVVTVDEQDDLHFRYLRTGGVWFDDPDADEITDFGSVVHAERLRPVSASPADQPDDAD
jgi:hypothetical protein